LYIARQDRAADYRRQAEEARVMAKWPSLNESEGLLLEIAEHLDDLAKLEEREAKKVMFREALDRAHDPVEGIAGYAP